jgi:hypothetical protein
MLDIAVDARSNEFCWGRDTIREVGTQVREGEESQGRRNQDACEAKTGMEVPGEEDAIKLFIVGTKEC